MTPSIRRGYELRATLEAAPAAVEEFCLEFRRQAAGYLAGTRLFAAELAVREALNNAVAHGCRGDARRHVRCVVRWGGGRLTVAVEDGGEGFDWRTALLHQAEDWADSGRGLGILLRYATRLRFNRKGNAVTMVRRF